MLQGVTTIRANEYVNLVGVNSSFFKGMDTYANCYIGGVVNNFMNCLGDDVKSIKENVSK